MTRHASEQWLRAFAEKWNFAYDDLLREASASSNDEWERYITAYDIDLHSAEELGEDHDLFWSHLEVLTGKTFDHPHRKRFGWSCSC